MKQLRLFLILVLAVLTLFHAVPASADTPDTSQDQNQVVHVVQPGENLFRISLSYGTTVNAIMAANGLTSTTIRTGQRLVIPRGSGAAVSPRSPVGAGGTYTVQRGDTLSGVAVRHGVTVWALRSANGLSSNTIYSGQKLVIPGANGAAPAPAAPTRGGAGSVRSSSAIRDPAMVPARSPVAARLRPVCPPPGRTGPPPGRAWCAPGGPSTADRVPGTD